MLLKEVPFCCEGDNGDVAVFAILVEDGASDDDDDDALNGAMMYEAVPDFMVNDGQYDERENADVLTGFSKGFDVDKSCDAGIEFAMFSDE